ncbi:hypothetical protein Tsubulata_025282 [Turnera subulata]|uniref:Neprosin PEP catalytic domain-containing protein n=1 Tax=Turnera subulata TaxID=218843 RepID=A0A9Q0JD99_9ROSI|nr:hypothetical protein Tsubulata_025282 [Turnera subulata]
MVKSLCSCLASPKGIGMVYLLGLVLFGIEVVEGNLPSAKKIMEARKRIDRLRSHAVRSIQSEDGDIIDCIDIYKQPAFDHPALRNHTIQLRPSYDPTMEEAPTETKTMKKKNEGKSRNDGSYGRHLSQLWQKNGSCPQGTVPVRRIREKELLRRSSLEDYGRKHPAFSSAVTKLNKETPNLREQNRSMAILLTEGFSYSGVKGDIRVWNPQVESDDEYSTSQVSLKSGPYYDFESLEAGWAVNPSVYGDRQTRLFVYWTTDASKTTGCFDVTCPGFVQTSNEIALGAAIYPLSVPFRLPYQITLYIFKDPPTGNWWVQYGERINLGYWPVELFGSLRGNAEGAEWGGEVYSSKIEQTPHTKTGMGSGQFPDVFGNSGCIQRMRIRENSMFLKKPEWTFTYADEYRCYDVWYVSDYVEDPEFYYGGPGQNPMCP